MSDHTEADHHRAAQTNLYCSSLIMRLLTFHFFNSYLQTLISCFYLVLVNLLSTPSEEIKHFTHHCINKTNSSIIPEIKCIKTCNPWRKSLQTVWSPVEEKMSVAVLKCCFHIRDVFTFTAYSRNYVHITGLSTPLQLHRRHRVTISVSRLLQ